MKKKYKVVKRKTRISAMVNGNSKYARKYEDGDSVYAGVDTLGILVFETLATAADWAWVWNNGYGSEYKDLIVLEVYPIGRGKRVRFVAPDPVTESIDNFYKGYPSQIESECPDRTMAYPGVHVIGQYEWFD